MCSRLVGAPFLIARLRSAPDSRSTAGMGGRDCAEGMAAALFDGLNRGVGVIGIDPPWNVVVAAEVAFVQLRDSMDTWHGEQSGYDAGISGCVTSRNLWTTA